MVLFAYFQVSRNKWQGRNKIFQVVNALGSMLLLGYSLKLHAYANVALNAIWLLIALTTIFGGQKKKTGKQKT
jgi:lipid-A-disaccharide synthase-like uncharacterized protein